MFSGAMFILSMSCVSGDEVQVAIHRKEDILGWLRTLDHEGSNWTVVKHSSDFQQTDDLTEDVMRAYGDR